MKYKSLVIIALFLGFTTQAQDTTSTRAMTRKEKKEAKRQKVAELMRQAEEGVLVFSKHSIFGVQLRTNGYGLFYELGKMKTNRKANIYRIDFTEVKENKEEKLSGNSFFGNAFIYGKINYFYPVTIGFGQQYILGQKGNKNGVAVSGLYNAGIAIGLLRPYYVTATDPLTGENKDIKYTPEDSALFLGPTINGGAGFGKGWSEIKVKPGAYAKIGLRFDYGRFNESVNAVEIGMSVDAYASTIPIMFGMKERRFFFQGYVAIEFGKRK